MRFLTGLVLASLLGMAGACGPTVDPAYKADLDRRLAAISTSEETFPPSEAFLPLPLAVGQWTQHRVKDSHGAVTLLTNKLVDQEEGGYWLESVTETYKGRQAVRLHVLLLSGRDPAGMEIRAIKLRKDQAAPVAIDPADLMTARPRYQHALDLLALLFEGEVKDDARVPAGHFIGCWTTETGGAWGPWSTSSVVCAHPSVPLSGVVRAQPADRSSVMELVGFGLTGAESEF